MVRVAEKYPTFIVPIPRAGGDDGAYEFYFLQWGFHGAPLVLVATRENAVNPPTSTVLLTPLEEYKRREAFATPHLVLTHYTDLARTHGIVLLRGEITPVAADRKGAGDAVHSEFLLGREEAHVMAVGVQKFYLWEQGGEEGVNERVRLLKAFHETPEDFKWEEVLKHANVTV
jgi:ATP synthase F1 complex assembly factor 1